MIIDIVKVFIPSTISFFFGILITPTLTDFLYSKKMWKKNSGKKAYDGNSAHVFNKLHESREVGTPKLGGVIIWISVFIVTLLVWFLSKIIPNEITSKLDFLSRNQTWIPLTTLITGGIVGAIDDFFEIKGNGDYFAGGLSLRKRVFLVSLIGLLCGYWFWSKLEVSSIGLPFGGEIIFGTFLIPLGFHTFVIPLFAIFFAMVMVFIYSGGVIDGLDGLAGGVFAVAFSAYAGIAFYQNQINLAAFCACVVGGILAFLWFNIAPARFYMSETGTMALTMTLTVVAFMTDSLGGGHGLLVLPVIAMPLIITTLSDIIQISSKKIRKKKVFLIAPLHHHFEALGWPAEKVTMRYWILSVVFGIMGLILGLL